MADKDQHDKDRHDKDKDKHEADKHAADQRQQHFDNPSQDPNHPANRTLSAERSPTPRSSAEAFNIPPADLLTAQEADQSSPVPGVGPALPAEVSPGPAVTIQEQGIGPRTPYPSGNPPPPAEATARTQGIKGVTDQLHVKPDKVEGPAGSTRKEPAR